MNNSGLDLHDGMLKIKVLIVDDDQDLAESLVDIIQPRGFMVKTARNAREARKLLNSYQTQIALVDLRLPDEPGTSLIPEIKKHSPEAITVMMTAYGDLTSAVDALEKGAFHYLRKPVSPEELLGMLDRAVETIQLRQEKELAVEALRESEERFRKFADEATFEGIIIHDRGVIIDANRIVASMCGYDRDQLIGARFSKIIAPAYHKAALEECQGGFEIPHEAAAVRRDGASFPVEIMSKPIPYHGKLVQAVAMRDITERRRLENQLRQAQKMEAVGTLASGLAHDFNNILQAISGYVQLLLSASCQGNKHRNYLTEIDQAVERATDLISRLLTFTHKAEPELKPLDLNVQILEAAKLLERIIPKMIQIKTRLGKKLPTVKGDPTQLEQIIMNLGKNAFDAMPQGGKLTIETDIQFLDPEFCRARPDLKPGDYVVLRVTDTGQGMDQETMKHIFEPFFTTKGVGQGTGLGMSMVYGIVNAHGGHITCYSEKDRGASFTIYFPALAKEEKATVAKVRLREKMRGGHETIMLVDDEISIIEVAQDILHQYGYTTITANCGEEALAIYSEKGRDIDLIILDLGMPGMGGQTCLIELLKINPQVSIIVSTGYGSSVQANACLKAGAKGFIGKPYRLLDMLKQVRVVLDGG